MAFPPRSEDGVPSIEIVLAEDHGLVRRALRALIESASDLHVVAEVGDGQAALDAVRRHEPDVLVLDLMLSGVSGLTVIEHVARDGGGTGVVVLTMHAGDAYVVEALRSGALGFVSKDAEAGDLLRAIRLAAEGQPFVGVELSDRALEAIEAGDGGDDPLGRLSDRERQTFHLAVQGLTNAEVAGRLFISPRTAEKHRARLLRKLGLRTQGDLVRFAVVRGLLPGFSPPGALGGDDADGEGDRS